MARIALALSLLTLAVSLPAEAAPAAPKKRCKPGYVLKKVKRPDGTTVKKCVKKKPAPGTQDQTVPTGEPDPTGQDGGTPQPPPAGPAQPPSQTTRDDSAGQSALAAAGDLLLEKAEIGNYTQTYYRLWFMQDGTFKYVQVSWMQQTGEVCDKSFTGTWAFKEGYTFTDQGGGTAVKVAISSNGPSGDEVLVFANQDRNAVYVGNPPQRFERNPNMLNNC